MMTNCGISISIVGNHPCFISEIQNQTRSYSTLATGEAESSARLGFAFLLGFALLRCAMPLLLCMSAYCCCPAAALLLLCCWSACCLCCCCLLCLLWSAAVAALLTLICFSLSSVVYCCLLWSAAAALKLPRLLPGCLKSARSTPRICSG